MTFKLPSLLQVRGEDDSGPQVWYAEAVGKISKNGQKFYEGYYLVPGDRPDRMVYDENYELIPEDSVMRILPVKTGYRSAWHMMGFVMRDDNTFYKIGDPMTDSGSEECFSDDDHRQSGFVQHGHGLFFERFEPRGRHGNGGDVAAKVRGRRGLRRVGPGDRQRTRREGILGPSASQSRRRIRQYKLLIR